MAELSNRPRLNNDGTYSGFTPPAWMLRAMDPANPKTKWGESIRSSSEEIRPENIPEEERENWRYQNAKPGEGPLGPGQGIEILFPLIRMLEDGTLRRHLPDPFEYGESGHRTPEEWKEAEKLGRARARDEAIEQKDYLVFDSPDEATKFSKWLSGMLGDIGSSAGQIDPWAVEQENAGFLGMGQQSAWLDNVIRSGMMPLTAGMNRAGLTDEMDPFAVNEPRSVFR